MDRPTWPRIRGTTTVIKSCEKMEVKGTEEEDPSWRRGAAGRVRKHLICNLNSFEMSSLVIYLA